MAKRQVKSLARRQAKLAHLLSLVPSGVYIIRPRRIDDHNMYWRAGWAIPQSVLDDWPGSFESKQYVLADTGTNRPVLTSSNKEYIREALRVWRKYGVVMLYDPDKKDEVVVPRTPIYVTKRFAHKLKRRGIK